MSAAAAAVAAALSTSSSSPLAAPLPVASATAPLDLTEPRFVALRGERDAWFEAVERVETRFRLGERNTGGYS
jgi:hypothetical protein